MVHVEKNFSGNEGKKDILIQAKEISKVYSMGEVEVHALKKSSFDIREGEFVVILGPSGSGKSTLLNLLGGMDLPSHGEVLVKGEAITHFSDRELTGYRRNKVGFVFQFYNLMANLTARENVELATEIGDTSLDLDEVIEKVGLKDRSSHFPSQLSGGEQQRVAIARAVAKNPLLLLCDEPTGALDFETGVKILALLKEVNITYGKTVIIITHNMPVGAMGDRVIRMRSGEITDIECNANPVDPERIEW
ncbi:putative ABC transport system ATP-binding protein [Tindallia magadiensis]|uniref:Putative ABC transport system ATP-binding protein n=1 Tax=Tindallia magadiensis TaxID=69895 RepID=A0A1I3C3F2_9FIRM|nr:ABC transporter ATP-binding protein [Tindallia magadiensis]SFH69042.1 putative ABC transport system ATP-binding protein [Tindallia magadiensis]